MEAKPHSYTTMQSTTRHFILRALTLLVSSALFVTFGYSSIASADIDDLTVSTGCTSVASYTGKVSLKKGTYEVYVKLGRRGEQAKAATYVKAQDSVFGDCTALGKVEATGDTWHKTGVLTAASEQQYIVQLASQSMANIPDANRPSVLLVPRSKQPICKPTDQCYMEVGGEKAYLRPPGTLLNQDSLHVLVATDPSKDEIKDIRYYVGNYLAYTSDRLNPFDARYIEYAGQPLAKVIEYRSGQQVVIEEKASLSHQDSFGNFLFRLLERYPRTFETIAWLGGGAIMAFLALMGARVLRRRDALRIHHGFKREPNPSFTQRIGYFLNTHKAARAFRLAAIVLGIVVAQGALIVLVYTYVLQIVTVDGKSMEPTFHTGDQAYVYKFPKTLAGINRREFTPQRGQVIVVRAQFGNRFTTTKESELLLIKRVIGLPGERVVIKRGQTTVYNNQHPEGFDPDIGSRWQNAIIPNSPSENLDITLEEGELFVSGDNRPESIDSRFNGPIDTKNVIGVVIGQ